MLKAWVSAVSQKSGYEGIVPAEIIDRMNGFQGRPLVVNAQTKIPRHDKI